MSETDLAANPPRPKKWKYGREAAGPAPKPPRPKKWTYGRPVSYRPPWKEILRPVTYAAMIMFALGGMFRLVTVGSPEKFRAQHHAMDIAEMWYAARLSGAVEAERIRDERQAVDFLLAGVDMNMRAADNRLQLKLSREECEAALPYLKWKQAEGSSFKILSFKPAGRE